MELRIVLRLINRQTPPPRKALACEAATIILLTVSPPLTILWRLLYLTMPSYKYRQLEKGEIRILILSPQASTATDRVECSLEHVLLSDQTDFEALSYCWGNSACPRSVLCAGNTLNVNPNLFSALLYLAYPNRERRLWVDAICINQADDKEKNMQVQLMAQIYSIAQQTL